MCIVDENCVLFFVFAQLFSSGRMKNLNPQLNGIARIHFALLESFALFLPSQQFKLLISLELKCHSMWNVRIYLEKYEPFSSNPFLKRAKKQSEAFFIWRFHARENKTNFYIVKKAYFGIKTNGLNCMRANSTTDKKEQQQQQHRKGDDKDRWFVCPSFWCFHMNINYVTLIWFYGHKFTGPFRPYGRPNFIITKLTFIRS